MLNLKNLRKSKKLTQEQVAKIIHTTPTCYNYYEKGKREPSIDTLIKLADFYNVSIDYLIGRDYINDVGYLTEQQKNIVNKVKQLDEQGLMCIESYIDGMRDINR